MNDRPDPLLQALGELERDHARDHPGAWDDVLIGRRSAAEVAASPAHNEAEEQAALASLFTGPIPAAEVDGLIERTLASWGPALPASPTPPVVVPLFRRRSTWTAVVVVLAVAAAILLWLPGLWVPGQPQPGDMLVAYTVVERSQGLQATRTDNVPPTVHRYQSSSTIHLVISPEHGVTEATELRVLARDHDGHETLFEPVATRSAEGTIRILGRLDTVLPLGPGRWRLSFVVSRPGASPRDAAAVTDALAAGTATMPPDPLELEVVAPAN